jgi:cytochrome c
MNRTLRTRAVLLTCVYACFFTGAALAQSASADKLSAATLKSADIVSGEQTWQQYCAFCHTLRKGEADITGPNLHKVFQRKTGGKPGFDYSDAMRSDGRDWTPELFDRYVRDPQATVPGNRMPAMNIPVDKAVPLLAYVLRSSGSVNWDEPAVSLAAGGLDAELQEKQPKFWSQWMENTVRFTLPYDQADAGQGTYTFVAYFHNDGTISGNNRGLKGIWRMRDKRTFCYAIQGVAVAPHEWVECVKPKADEPLEFGPVLRSVEIVNGIDAEMSFLEGRPHPLEGDAHPDYWVFLFNNSTRYEIKVDGNVQIVEARFNEDKTITSPQGVTGQWRTAGSAGKDEKMCYSLSGVPGVEGELSECFALVLMFNPRVGARWPARFEQGNSYWAEITAGR